MATFYSCPRFIIITFGTFVSGYFRAVESGNAAFWAVERMQKTRVVIYLDEEQRKGLEWHKRTSISEVGRRAIEEYLK